MQAYHNQYTNYYFWRTIQKQEIDLVEESGGNISAFEFKWKNSGRKKTSKSFTEAYSAKSNIIDRDNFREFVMNKMVR